MGLFNFMKSAGAKLFGGKKTEEQKVVEQKIEETAETGGENPYLAKVIQDHVISLDYGVENFNVQVVDDVCTVTGNVGSTDTAEKIAVTCGNIKGIATVDSQLVVDAAMAAEEEESKTQFHTVVKGDYLSKIAKQYYGKGSKYPVIFEANKPMLSDPDLIYPGQVLRIPNIDETA